MENIIIETPAKKTRGRPKKPEDQKVAYDQKKYNRTFYDKYSKEKQHCNECGKEYTRFTKSYHLRSAFHTKTVIGERDFLLKKINELTDKIKNLK